MTLTEFLLARIAEDEAVARDLVARDVFAPTQGPDMARVHEDDEYDVLVVGAGRVLADCAAKLRIVDLGTFSDSARSAVDFWLEADQRDLTPPAYTAAMIEVFKSMAAIYSDHPDYRDEWKPYSL